MTIERPINLDLTKFRFPPMAIVSIGHRISGVLLFLLIPLMLYLLHHSIISSTAFSDLQQTFVASGWLKFWVWVLLTVTFFHLFAGIRHLIMDLGFGESVHAGKCTAYVVFILSLVATILAGIWVW